MKLIEESDGEGRGAFSNSLLILPSPSVIKSPNFSFFTEYYSPEDIIEIRIIHSCQSEDDLFSIFDPITKKIIKGGIKRSTSIYRKVKDLNKIVNWIKEKSDQVYNIYYGLQPRYNPHSNRPSYRRDVKNCVGFALDIDGILPPQAEELLNKHIIPYSVLIGSGNGTHVLTFFNHPVPINIIEDQWKLWVKKVSKLIPKIDVAVCDISRILRLPGTLNWKEIDPKDCYIYLNKHLKYSLEDLNIPIEYSQIEWDNEQASLDEIHIQEENSLKNLKKRIIEENNKTILSSLTSTFCYGFVHENNKTILSSLTSTFCYGFVHENLEYLFRKIPSYSPGKRHRVLCSLVGGLKLFHPILNNENLKQIHKKWYTKYYLPFSQKTTEEESFRDLLITYNNPKIRPWRTSNTAHCVALDDQILKIMNTLQKRYGVVIADYRMIAKWINVNIYRTYKIVQKMIRDNKITLIRKGKPKPYKSGVASAWMVGILSKEDIIFAQERLVNIEKKQKRQREEAIECQEVLDAPNQGRNVKEFKKENSNAERHQRTSVISSRIQTDGSRLYSRESRAPPKII